MEKRFERKVENRARNLFYDQVYRLMIFLGLVLLMTFLLQIYTLKVEGRTDRAVRRQTMQYGEPTVDANGKEHYATAYVSPDKNDQADYYMHKISWRHPFRKIAGWIFTRFYRNSGWIPEIVNDIALRWLWILILAAIWLGLRAILSIRLEILIARQGRGENDGLRVRNFVPLYHDRFIRYLVVMTVAIAGPIKHTLLWPVLGSIFVVLSELWYMGRLVLITNPTNPHFAEEHWWIRMAIRVNTLFGFHSWRDSRNPVVYYVGKVIFTVVTVIIFPFKFVWEKVKKICVDAAAEYDRKTGYEDLGKKADGSTAGAN